MSTKIEWTDETWNPVTGCDKVSQGCKNCYAETIAHRFWGERKFTDVQMHPERLEIPLHWKKPRRIFVNSMSDLFHENLSSEEIELVFGVMAIARHHKYQILTKRPQVMNDFIADEATEFRIERRIEEICGNHGWCPQDFEWPLPNVWLGVSCEDQKTADERIPILLETPAAVRFVSLEPLLGPIDLDKKELLCKTWRRGATIGTYLDWVIVGGESGPNARPMHPDWVRSIRDQCQEAGVPFFFKQWGEWHYDPKYITGNHRCWMDQDGRFYTSGGSDVDYRFGRLCFDRVGKKAAGRLLDGRVWNEFPEEK